MESKPEPIKDDVRLPEGWEVGKIENYLDKIIDYRGKTPKKSNSGIETLSAKSIKNGRIDYNQVYLISKKTFAEWEKRGKPRIGDVVLTTEGPLGEVAQLDKKEVALSQRLIALRGKENELDNGFLKYFLMSPIGQHELLSRATGTTVQGIKQSEFRKIRVVKPPFLEQLGIAEILSNLDAKIELNMQMNQTLEAIGQAIFKRWFVDFEFPNGEGNPYKSSGGEMICNEKTHREIPKNWKVGTFADLAEIKHGDIVDGPFGSNLKSSDFTKTGVRLIHQENIEEFVFVNSKKRYTSNQKADSLSRSIAYPGNIVLTKMPEPIARAARIPQGLSERFIVMADCIRIKPHKEVSPSEYLLYLVNSSNFRKEAEARATGTTRPRINLTQVKSIDVTIPPVAYRVKFSTILDPLEKRRETNSIESQKLMEIRDLLLPKLMSGKIRVPMSREDVNNL